MKTIRIQKSVTNSLENVKQPVKTPSHLGKPVFVMSLPLHATFLPNNQWMVDLVNSLGDVKINVGSMIYEWSLLYSALSTEGIVLTFPCVPNLQDLHYVNSFVYLPHLVNEPTCVISKFRAEGRQEEERVAFEFLTQCGYRCVKSPFYFEGEPELKWVRDDIYVGSYGVRGEKAALDWIEASFNCKVFKVGKESEYLYHGDCIFWVVSPYHVLVGVNYCDRDELKKLENVVEVIPIEDDALLLNGVTNNVAVGPIWYVGDLTPYFKMIGKPDLIEVENKKKAFLEKIASKYGFEILYIPLSQIPLQGALLSCVVARLNYVDRHLQVIWREGALSLSSVVVENGI